MTELANFHFDPVKSGRILRQWLNEKGMTASDASALTGISYDTISNCMAGRLKEVSLDRSFKIALITGHSIQEYVDWMLDGEDVAFRSLLAGSQAVGTSEREQGAAPLKPEAPIPDGINAYMMEQNRRLREFYTNHIEKLEDNHAKEISVLKDTHKEGMDGIKNAYQEQIHRMEETIQSQKSTIKTQRIWLVITAAISVLALGMVSYDFLDRNVGWIRSFHLPDNSNTPIHSLRG